MCTLEDIRWYEDVTQVWTVNESGDALEFQDSTDGDFRAYRCENDFKDFNNWEEVQKHLKESKK